MAAEGGAGKLDGLKDLITTAGGALRTALPKKLVDPQRCLVGRWHVHDPSASHAGCNLLQKSGCMDALE